MSKGIGCFDTADQLYAYMYAYMYIIYIYYITHTHIHISCMHICRHSWSEAVQTVIVWLPERIGVVHAVSLILSTGPHHAGPTGVVQLISDPSNTGTNKTWFVAPSTSHHACYWPLRKPQYDTKKSERFLESYSCTQKTTQKKNLLQRVVVDLTFIQRVDYIIF